MHTYVRTCVDACTAGVQRLLRSPLGGHRTQNAFCSVFERVCFFLSRMNASRCSASPACICLCLRRAVHPVCQAAVVYEVPLTVETIRPVKGRVFCLPLLPTARLDLQPMVEIKRALLRGMLRLDLGRILRKLHE